MKTIKSLEGMKTLEFFDLNDQSYLRCTDYKNRKYIILMSTPAAIHILTAALKIKSNDRNRGVKARAVVLKFSTSTWVSVPIGTVTAILALIDAFNAAIGVAKTPTWNAVNTALKAVMGTFSAAMGLNPVHAEEICVSGGFFVKGVGIKQKNIFGLFQDTTSGSFHCIGDVLNVGCIHEWKLGSSGTVLVMQRATQNAFKQFSGLAPGRYWVSHQCINDNGTNGVLRTLFIDLI